MLLAAFTFKRDYNYNYRLIVITDTDNCWVVEDFELTLPRNMQHFLSFKYI